MRGQRPAPTHGDRFRSSRSQRFWFGVFSTQTWERVARDDDLAYPEKGKGVGIGPLTGQVIPVAEMDFAVGEMRVASPDGKIILRCESSGIAVEESEA